MGYQWWTTIVIYSAMHNEHSSLDNNVFFFTIFKKSFKDQLLSSQNAEQSSLGYI